MVSALPVPGRAAWESHPWVTLSGGYENERFRDSDDEGASIPGGALLGSTPGVRLRGWMGGRCRLDLTGQLAFERFRNDAGRVVLGGAVEGDLRVDLGRSWVLRTTLGGTRFSDTADDLSDRVGGGFETGVGKVRPGWSFELLGGVEGRHYDHALSWVDRTTYDYQSDAGLSGGLGGSVRIGACQLGARALRQHTYDREPLYDADDWLAQGTLRAPGVLGTTLAFSGLTQARVYPNRPDSADHDSYWQAGIGVDRPVTRTVSVTARYAFARLLDPLRNAQDMYRATLSLTWEIGAPLRSAEAGDLRLPRGPIPAPIRERDLRLFRCHAPGAREVSLVGDFNGWDPAAHPMAPRPAGWWEIEVQLPAGQQQYAYSVDGTVVPPTDADAMVDDGFGGRNGLIWVLPPGR